MKKLICLLVLIMMASNVALAEENLYVNEEYGVRLVFPEGWFVIGEEQREQYIKKQYTGQDWDRAREEGRISLIQVVASRDKAKYPKVEFLKTFNPYIIFGVKNISKDSPVSVEKWKSGYKKFEDMNLGRIVDSPNEIVAEEIRGVRGALEIPLYGNTSYIVSECYLVKNDKVYYLTLTCKTEDYPKLKEDFEKVINSLEIK